jgi:hypothetical protein
MKNQWPWYSYIAPMSWLVDATGPIHPYSPQRKLSAVERDQNLPMGAQ